MCVNNSLLNSLLLFIKLSSLKLFIPSKNAKITGVITCAVLYMGLTLPSDDLFKHFQFGKHSSYILRSSFSYQKQYNIHNIILFYL